MLCREPSPQPPNTFGITHNVDCKPSGPDYCNVLLAEWEEIPAAGSQKSFGKPATSRVEAVRANAHGFGITCSAARQG